MSAPPRIVWRSLLARTSRRTRALVGAAALLGTIGRLGVVATALQIAHADARGAALVGALAGAAFVVQRVVTAVLRVHAECDLHRAAARAMLDADVLEIPSDDVQRLVFEGNHVGRTFVSSTLPALLADTVSTLAIGPIFAALFPVRVLALAAVSLIAVLGTLQLLRRITMSMQERVHEVAERVADGILVVAEGRLELVARGGEAAFGRAYEATLAEYTQVATRAALGSALLGRVPLVVGAAVVAAVTVVDGTSRDALATTVLGEALLFAAAMPALLGLVFGVHDMVRNTRVVAPLVALLELRARADVLRGGAPAASAPTPFRLERVTFAYGAGRNAVAEIDAEWNPGAPLVVTGPNGGGKSTVLRLLLGLRPPTAGVVRFGADDLAALDLRGLRRRMAYLPQRPYLGEAYHSVRTAMRLGRADASDEAMTKSLGRSGLLLALRARQDDPLAVRLGELSAGQRQRLALARILLQDAPIVLLDEPDANLDREGVRLVVELVGELVAAGKMVAIAAHTPELVDVTGSQVTLER